MSILVWMLAVVVGLTNLAFNVQTQRAALNASSWGEGIWSLQFLIPFMVGCASLLFLYTLYRQQVQLAQAISFMGAVSIVGGTIFGVVLRGNRLDIIEWCLVSSIALLFVYRLLKPALTRYGF